MKVRDLGEFGLISRLEALVSREGHRPGGLLLGIGDDAAAWRPGRGVELLTTDTLVLGVHFPREGVPWRDLGWKAMAVNQSDIAAMGGAPLYALVTLGLTGEEEVEALEELYRGMLEACAAAGGAIVGGDVVGAPCLFITVTLAGTAPVGPLGRGGARPGDLVAVTGPLGASAAGLRLLLKGAGEGEEARALVRAHLRPTPRVAEGQALARLGATSAIDISDGLVADLSHLCLRSGVSVRLEATRVPVHPALQALFPQEALAMALTGGEDYELVFTAPPAAMERISRGLPAPCTVVGTITAGPPGRVEVVGEGGRPLELPSGGWDHFRRGP